MEDIKEKVKDKQYRNWVKSTLGLDQTKKAVQGYVEQKFTAYLDGKARLHHGQIPLTKHEISHIQGTEYIRHSLDDAADYTGSKWIWNKTKYDCLDCEASFEKILSLHRKGRAYKHIHWKNSANTTKIPLEWAIAKIFMSQGNDSNSGPDKTDPYAMFHLMLMCDLFYNCIRNKTLEELKEVRNTIFHSDNFVSDEEEDAYFDLMTGLLRDASNDMEVPQTTRDSITEDITKMENLQRSDLTMTVFDDLEEALRIKRTAIYYDFEKSFCENDPEKLRELLKISEQIGGNMQLLKKHLHDLKNIDKYKNEIDDLRKQRDDIRDIAETVARDLKDKNTQLKTEVVVMTAGCKQYADNVQRMMEEKLKSVPNMKNIEQLRDDVNGFKSDLESLKETAGNLPMFSNEMHQVQLAVGGWQRALRAEVSELESVGVMVVTVATVIISLLLRQLLEW